MLRDNNWVKAIKECLIKHFAFYYNSTCRVHEDAKYGIGWWLQELELNYTKAIRELDNKQDRIHYKVDIYGSFINLEPVIYLIKENNKVVSNDKTF